MAHSKVGKSGIFHCSRSVHPGEVCRRTKQMPFRNPNTASVPVVWEILTASLGHQRLALRPLWLSVAVVAAAALAASDWPLQLLVAGG